MRPDPISILWREARRLHARARAPRALPPLLFFTDPQRTPSPELTIARLPRGSGVVLRTFGRAEIEAKAPKWRALARRRGVLFLVGADLRLARRLKADGVHLPQRELRGHMRRRSGLITGAAHNPLALRGARLAGVQAAVVSPVFPSKSPSAGRLLGTVRLARWVRMSRLPVYALGGVTVLTAKRLRSTGVVGIAAIDGLRT